MKPYIPYIIFIAASGAYALTCAPLITAGDSGELVAAAFTLGIPHPPGYPFYSIMGKAFSFLPFGEPAYRLGLLSVVGMASAAALVYATAVEAVGHKGHVPAAATALAWSFGLAVWTQATYAEVYTVQLSLGLAAVYAVVRASRGQDRRWLHAASFACGLSVSAHFAALMFVPALLFFILRQGRAGGGFRGLPVSAFFFLLGLTPFLYLPVRAAAGPEVNWGNPGSFASFAAHVTRATYGDLAAMAGLVPGKGAGIAALIAGLAAAVVAAVRLGARPSKAAASVLAATALGVCAYMAASSATAAKAAYFWELAWSSGAAVCLPLALIGLAAVYARDREVFVFMVLLITVVGALTFYRIPQPGTYNFQPLADKFFLPLSSLVFVSAAAGAARAGEWLKSKNGVVSYLPYLALAVPAALAVSNYSMADRSEDFVAHDYSAAVMRTPTQGSVFLAEGDNHVFITLYQRVTGNTRRDVDVFTPGNISPFPSGKAALAAMADKKRAVYASSDTLSGIVLEPVGLLNRMPSAFSPPAGDPWAYYYVRGAERQRGPRDFLTGFMLADYFFSWARSRMLAGDREGSMELLDRAVGAGRDLVWVNVGIGEIYLKYEYPEKARALFERALEIAPQNPDAKLAMGRYYVVAGMPGQAEKSLVEAVALNAKLGDAWLLLAEVREAREDYWGAAKALAGYLRSGSAGGAARSYEVKLRRLEEIAREREKSE